MILAALLAAVTAAQPAVTIDTGTLAGTTGVDGRAVFRGIPFAAPPVGPLRWRAPQPARAWTGMRDASHAAPGCPQVDYGWNHLNAAAQSEDCLYLDVATPALTPARPWPVMVWIHGGGNRAGGAAGTVDSALVAQGVVLVSIQYRLGALGFMSHPALSAEGAGRSGNYGLMDQQAALRWVRRNIARFGGDPANVTIFGESAGAQDVGLQLLSPAARGLFAKAIEESGTPGFGFAPRSLGESEAIGARVAQAAGAAPQATAAGLRALPAEALVKAGDAVDVPALADRSYIWLQATVDGAVITETPATTLARGGEAPVPLIVGSNARELPLPGGAAGVERAIRDAYTDVAAARAFYGLGASARPVDDPRLGDMTLQLATDTVFRCPALNLARAHAARAATWHYQFDVAGAGGAAVAHNTELAFVFGPPAPAAPLAPYWANFARSGDPNGAGLPRWPRYREGHTSLLFQNGGPATTSDLRAAPCTGTTAY